MNSLFKNILLKIPLIKWLVQVRKFYRTGKFFYNHTTNKQTVGQKNESFRFQWTQKQLQSIPQGARILDAGAGEQRFKEYCKHLQYVAQDFAQYDGKGNQIGLQTQTWDTSSLDIISDITAIPEPNQSFDAILCTEVLEHIPNPIAAMEEFARLIKRGGKLIITTPFCSLTHFAPYHYSTGFSKYFYEYHLHSMGFVIEEITPNGNFFEYLAQEIRRIQPVAFQYTNTQISEQTELAQKEILKTLDQLSQKDTSSHELLCFGYLLTAKKL